MTTETDDTIVETVDDASTIVSPVMAALTEAPDFSDDLDPVLVAMITEILDITKTMAASPDYVLLTESMEIGDFIEKLIAIGLVSEGLTMDGTWTSMLRAVAVFTELVNSVDSMDVFGSYAADVTESLVTSLTLLLAYQGSITETADFTDLHSIVTKFVSSLIEAMTVGDTDGSNTMFIVTVAEGTTLADADGSLISITEDVLENLKLWLSFTVDDASYDGWTVNAEGANPHSALPNYPFNSYAYVAGSYYGLSGTKLYKIDPDAADAAGSEIESILKTGKTDFGSHNLKRVKSAQLVYCSDDKMRLRAVAEINGTQKSFVYEVRPTSRTVPGQANVFIHRGLMPHFWQFEIHNVSGGDFDFQELRVFPIDLNRRK